MTEKRYIAESVSTIRNLMNRMGENLIMEGVEMADVAMKTSIKTPLEGLTNGVNVIVNTAMGKVVRQYQEIYINYDITGTDKDTFITVFKSVILDLSLNKCRRYDAKKNDITYKQLGNSGDFHLTHTIRILNEDEIRRAHSIYNTLDAASGGNMNMSWEDVETMIRTSGRVQLLNTNSIKGKNILRSLYNKASDFLRTTTSLIKRIFGKEPDATDVGKQETKPVIDPKTVFGHQLSEHNKALIIVQSQEYGVPTPEFVCKSTMITGKRPYGFERKFKENIEIHPYYIVANISANATLSSLKKQFNDNEKDKEMLQNNPQILHALGIENGDHSSDEYQWVVYYDIAETEPVNPEDDVFTETYGSVNNLDHIANDKVKQLGNSHIEGNDEDNSDAITDNIENEELPHDEKIGVSPFVEKINLIKQVADEMGMQWAYKKVNISGLPRKLRFIVMNLCMGVIAKKNPHFGKQEQLVHAAPARDIVLDSIDAGQLKMSNINDDVIAKDAAQEIIAHIQSVEEPLNNVGLVGESFLGRCLANAING